MEDFLYLKNTRFQISGDALRITLVNAALFDERITKKTKTGELGNKNRR